MPINVIPNGIEAPQINNPLDTYAKSVQLKSLLQQNQMQDMQMQDMQRQKADEQAAHQIIGAHNGDLISALPELSAKVSPKTYIALQKTAIDLKKSTGEMKKVDLENEIATSDQMLGLITQSKQLSPEEYAQRWPEIANRAVEINPKLAGRVNPAQPIPQQGLDSIGLGFMVHSQIAKRSLEERQVEEAKQKAAESAAKLPGEVAKSTEAVQEAALGPEGRAKVKLMGDAPTEVGLQMRAQQGDPLAVATLKRIQSGKIQVAGAEAQARQAAAQGDPAVAGKMLADGSLTLTELKVRGTTPQFIQKVTQEAQKIDHTYNPADEVVAESVAKSQTANQFFGSANSLINKGGTLDQLEQRGKNIPQGQFPALNSIKDWEKLATGEGPLAGYAATALGVADDYGKVMGGGTASDHARDAALNLFAKAASPKQRAEAISATRDAVTSQRDSRIGKNKFLKRMYGSDPAGGASGKEIHYKVVNGQLVAQ